MRDLWRAPGRRDPCARLGVRTRPRGRGRFRAPAGRLLCALLGAGGPAGAAAAPTAEPPLTLAAAVELAVRENPELAGARARWAAAQEAAAQARALPNPMFQYSGMDAADNGSWPNTNEKRFMVQQPFPWFGKRGLRGRVAEQGAAALHQEYEALLRDIVMQVKEAYFDWYGVQRSAAITRAEGDVLQRLVKIAETMYATGDRTQQDVLKAQAEITMLQTKLLELDRQAATLKARLNQLLNRRADAPLGLAVSGPPADTALTAGQLFALAARHRPEIKGAAAQLERSQAERRLMQKEYWPDYRLGLEYRNFRSSDPDMFMATVSIDLPFWQSKYRAGVREAEQMIAASRAAREAAVQQASFDVQDAWFKLQTARRTLELYRKTLIPQAEERFQASDASYRTGRVDFMDLLESERFLLNARTMAALAEGAVGMQWARLERAVGTDLPAAAPAEGTKP